MPPKFKDIGAWELAQELTRKICVVTKKAKPARNFGLKGQVQDAAGNPKPLNPEPLNL